MTTDVTEQPTDNFEPSRRERRSVSEMLGEVMREVAVLLLVFMPLDLAIQGHGLTTRWVTAILALPAAFLVAGIYVERTRKQ